ncbi:Mo-dependent nitrogenase C-terminal domain-containing protein [Leptolyngbya sp. AN03gr2]|uniref:Mo-dependent nitrogenase C-terminal domain-containing protein n=1 Tax=unclassified Leptolyngbya TaxID=2650499 RepID=UPI003D3217D7
MITVVLNPLRKWLDSIEIANARTANLLCQLIPAQCPFACKVKLFNQTILTIPPLCKLNPFYEQFIMIRWRALTYLVEQCGQDVTSYC